MISAPDQKKALGRPLKTVDWKLFDKLCYLQCTLEQISNFFECDHKTIEAMVKREKGISFSQYAEYKRAPGKIDLLGWQMQAARKGNAAMQIWCGKQHLGQKDRVEASGPGGLPLVPPSININFVTPDADDQCKLSE